MLIQVALPTPVRTLFTYKLPNWNSTESPVGYRVLVHLGKRLVQGFCVALESNPTNSVSIRDIDEILLDSPPIPSEVLRLTQWISDYYMCSWGEALRSTLPAFLLTNNDVRILASPSLSQAPVDEILMGQGDPKMRAVSAFLQRHPGSYSLANLSEKTGISCGITLAERLRDLGLIELSISTKPLPGDRVISLLQIAPAFTASEALRQLMADLDRHAPKQALAMGYMIVQSRAGIPLVRKSELVDQTHVSQSVVDALISKGLVVESRKKVRDLQRHGDTVSTTRKSGLHLSEEQTLAVNELSELLDSTSFHVALLHGVTGSGKTIVYLELIRKVLERGQSVLYLVPEISLSNQLIGRIRDYLGIEPGLFHSSMSDAERYDIWLSCQSGAIRLVVGARSALFAPMQNLGLIIVDEEHDNSYKQSSPNPRYQARDCAIVRARLAKALCVLGSATPSMETVFNADHGRYRYVQMSSRADNATMPTMHLVDVKQARKSKEMFGNYSLVLIKAILDRLAKRERSIVLQNRRGYSHYISCASCGNVPKCRDCSVSLTYHKSSGELRCHYCGYTETVKNYCSSCGSTDLTTVGYGTQRVEEDLQDLLAEREVNAKILRLDGDTMSKKGTYEAVLHEFTSGDAQILLGTQIVAKGLDFPDVTLVGVVNADLNLFSTDFRATERTYQLLTQVAGRAGRASGVPGEVIIQTTQPEHIAIQSALRQDFRGLYTNELQQRRETGYPPFTRLVVLEVSGTDEGKVQRHAEIVAALFPRDLSFLSVTGPITPVVERIKTMFRRAIVVRSLKESDPGGQETRRLIWIVLEEYKKAYAASKIRINVDVDYIGPL